MVSFSAPVSSRSATLLGAPHGDLVLRIRGSSRDGQVVRLKSAKCTIGSGRHATLRLRACGVRKLHCLILRGPQRTIVRNWASDSRLNGRAFCDAALSAGDRLGVGPVEFEVLEAGSPVTTADRAESTPRPEIEAQSVPEDVTTIAVQAERGRLAVERADLDRQAQDLLKERQAWLDQTARLDEERAALERRRQQFDDRMAEWDTERAATQARLDAELREVDRRASELHEQELVLKADRGKLETERSAREARQSRQQQAEASQRLSAVEKRRAEIEDQERKLHAEREEWETQRARADSQLADRWQEVDKRLAELLAEERVLEDQREEWRRERVEAETRMNEKCRAIEEEIAAFEAERAAWEQTTGQSPPVERTGGSVPAVSEPAAPPTVEAAARISPPKPAEPEAEESIDDYMAKLMARVGGGKRKPEPSAIIATTEPEAEAAAAELEAPASRPRRVAVPERLSDLSAMRELANVAARGAIDSHARRQLLGARYGKLLVAVLGVISGIALFNLSAVMGDLTYYAGILAFMVAIYWGLQYAVLTGHLRVGPRGQFSWQWRKVTEPATPDQSGAGSRPDPGQTAP